MDRETGAESNGNRWWLILLVIPLIATLWPPFYAHDTPMLGGIPFFYWYQFLWVIITVVITAVVYFLVRD